MRFISPDGDDQASGAADAPWATLQHAADTVEPGTTVVVGPGTYAGFTMRRSGAPGAQILFRAADGVRPSIQDTKRRYLVLLQGARDVELSGFEIRAASQHEGAGIFVEQGSARIWISGNHLVDNQSFGVLIASSQDVTVTGNDISGSASGVRTRGAVPGTVITDNDIHANDLMVVNDPEPNNDTGGQGVAVSLSSGPITIRDNRIWGNRARSFDYGEDGAAFEIFGSSHVLIEENVMWDNETVMETGTNATQECVDITFVRNVAFARSTWGESKGILLRCAKDSLVAQNTLYGMDAWVLQFRNRPGTGFAGSLENLTVVNNILSGAIALYVLDPLPASSKVDFNLVDSRVGVQARSEGRYINSLSQVQSLLGIQRSGRYGPLGLVDPEQQDVHLKAGSPAIDGGMRLPGINDDFAGTAPDIGRFEHS
ncbi:MAG TPA: right-handed parallel beta-helix repeat-containing protein [Candidatus Limnocylindria bacterium]|nr:right-handed parallel beta-helix repeat-containing protein [Candidatus Limnocylindria bacterium]